MDKHGSNTWLKNEKNQINYYTNSSEIIMVERKRSMKILADLTRYHFNTKENLNILDLGCGDGVITEYLSSYFPANNYYLLDGSSEMLNLAKQKIGNDKFYFINKTFEEYIKEEGEEPKYDLIFSSNAIHHMDYSGKMKLFSKIFMDLKTSGLFVNIDLVKPSTQKTEELQFNMWIDWINENLANMNFSEHIGEHNNLPHKYKSKTENKPSRLFDQLDLLNKVGFHDVDCFFKYSIFAIYGGIKH